jgi:hypothetical protein
VKRYSKVFSLFFMTMVCLSAISCADKTDSSLNFVKSANWLGHENGDIYLLQKKTGGQAKNLDNVFSSYDKFKEVSWNERTVSFRDKEYIIIEARGLLNDSDELDKIINDLLNQNEDWVLKNLTSRPANLQVDTQVLKKVLNDVKGKKLNFMVSMQFLPELKKSRARFIYLGGALVDQNGNIVHADIRIKNYNITIEETNLYRNIGRIDVKKALAEMILTEQGYKL